MKKFLLIAFAFCVGTLVYAQEPAPSPGSSSPPAAAADVEALRQQVQSLTETVKALQQQVKDQQAALEKANLTGESGLPQNPEPSPIAGAEGSPVPGANAPPRFPTEDTSVVTSTAAPAVSGTPTAGTFPTTDTSVVKSAPETISSTGAGAPLTQPITIGGGKNYMNISLDGLFALAYSSARDLNHIEVGDHDPQQRGFNARNTELAFDGAVDPYFEGFANIVFKLDNDNETEVEVEEAFMQTTNLPYNLQLKAGQFLGAFGSNETGADSRTQIYGADLLYKWKSSHAEGGFPFVKWQTEAMYRRFQAGRGANESFPVAETFHDWGLYSQVLWGFKKGWVAGIRGDYVDMQDSKFTDDLDRQSRWRISANLTWYPTEFSKIRLQYNQDFLEENFFLSGRQVESVFLQWEFILGSHGAHKF